jgi:hypothetical protein
MSRPNIEFVERRPRLLPRFGHESEFDHVLAGYFAVTPTQAANDRYRNARLRHRSAGSIAADFLLTDLRSLIFAA